MRYEKYNVEDVKKASSENRFTTISCFAGGGGSSTGYRLAGGNILLINEFVESAVETYTANFPDSKVLVDDIKKYTSQDFLDIAGIAKGELDILDGSPPCSAFSVAGKREKGWGKEKNYSDGKKQVAIEDLFYEFIRIAEGIQPKIIIAENVKGITFGESKSKLNAFINEFEKIGYDVTYEVLNGADYGVPQARERTIFICVREDVSKKIGLSFLNLHNLFPKPTVENHISIKEALAGIENDKEEVQMLLDYVQGGFQKKWVEILPFNPKKHIKPNDNQIRIIPKEKWQEYKAMGFQEKNAKPVVSSANTTIDQLMKKDVKHYEWDTDKEYYFVDINYKKSMFNMIRPSADLPCPTLTQRGQQRSVSGVFHPEENRKFTIKEFKRLMGFPEDFVLKGKFDAQAERLGRAVAPLMYKAVANSLYDNILKEYNNG
jgi:DNA (cytosine-5)-methyltransferase 1